MVLGFRTYIYVRKYERVNTDHHHMSDTSINTAHHHMSDTSINTAHRHMSDTSIIAVSSLLGLSPKCSQLINMWSRSHDVTAPYTQFLRSQYPHRCFGAVVAAACLELTRLAVLHVRHSSVCVHSGAIVLGGCHLFARYRRGWVAAATVQMGVHSLIIC